MRILQNCKRNEPWRKISEKVRFLDFFPGAVAKNLTFSEIFRQGSFRLQIVENLAIPPGDVGISKV